ncbi:MAG: tetratricopeptide repeat protein [Verrucomicrobiota bacterium]
MSTSRKQPHPAAPVPVPKNPRVPGWNWRDGSILAFLWLGIAFAFAPALRNGFVNFDDGQYVYENPLVARGLSSAGAAFTRTHADNWHPVTTLSHLLDVSLYGMNPAGHHLSSIVIHGFAAALLYLALRRLTGWRWTAAWIAAAFAWHPLRVESVAWISERKDVLSGVFLALTLWAYGHWTDPARRAVKTGWYTVSLGAFALGLMSKPTLVGLPLVLLLLDYWPLRRFSAAVARERFVEKIPFVLLSLADCAITLVVQRGALHAGESIPGAARFANIPAAIVDYLKSTAWPAGLAPFYPFPAGGHPASVIAASTFVVAAITAGAWLWRRRVPAAGVGWGWFLIMLLPVIGILQAGFQARADRYTYLSQIGLFLAVAGAAWQGAVAAPFLRRAAVAAGCVLLGIWLVMTRQQCGWWRDSETLWRRALACTVDNGMAEGSLGAALQRQGRAAEALPHLERAASLQPGPAVYANWGSALLQTGHPREAIRQLDRALELGPDSAGIRNNLGVAYQMLGDYPAAAAAFERALAIEPGRPGTCRNLAWLLATCPDPAVRNGPRAVELVRRAQEVSTAPSAGLQRTLAAALAECGRFSEAVAAAQEALRLAPMQPGQVQGAELAAELQLYHEGKPVRDPADSTRPPGNR